MSYMLAIDQGTTGSRAIVYDKAGGRIAGDYREHRQIFPRPGWVEHDPNEIWHGVNECIRAVLKQVPPGSIAAIGITNQRETTVVWDRETGEPVCNAIVWQCRRTAARCDELRAEADLFRDRTGLPIDAYFSATKIEWILRNVPGAMEKAKSGKLLFGTTDSWVLWKLTGGRVHATDYTNASRTMLFNIETLAWDEEIIGRFGIPASMLPEVKPSSGVIGHTVEIGALPAGIPISGIAGDQQAALFGQACFEPGTVKNTYGTGSFILLNAGKKRPVSEHGLIVTIACGRQGEPVYALEGAVFVAGAAHPVTIGGEQPDATMSKKMENDAAAFVRSIAARRHRNVKWAEQMVRGSVSASETEAKKLNIIDIIAKDQNDLFRQIDGRKVDTNAGVVTIRANNPEVRRIGASAREKFLHVVGNPNVAYILMLIAIYGIIFELSNPGAILPGVAGGIALILALFSFAVLPVNLAGALLIVFAVALLLIEVFTPTHGILTVGGIIAFVVGSLILFQTQSPAFRISVTLVVTMAILTGAFFLFAVGSGIRAQRNKVVTGKEGMIDETAEARTDIDPRGKIFAEGTLWNAVTEGEPIKKGETVRIVSFDKLLVKVKKEA